MKINLQNLPGTLILTACLSVVAMYAQVPGVDTAKSGLQAVQRKPIATFKDGFTLEQSKSIA